MERSLPDLEGVCRRSFRDLTLFVQEYFPRRRRRPSLPAGQSFQEPARYLAVGGTLPAVRPEPPDDDRGDALTDLGGAGRGDRHAVMKAGCAGSA